MKKLVSSFIFLLLICIGGGAFAEENVETSLTDFEKTYLLETGHTVEEIESLPVEVAKQLVKEKAVINDKGYDIVQFLESSPSKPGQISTMGSISSSTMKLSGTVYKVTSDKAYNDKFYIYGNFTWLKTPSYTLVDKMTFGFPSSSGLYLPTSSGLVTQHQHRYSQDPQGNGNWIDYAIDYSPSDWEPSAGVAGDFDLRSSTSLTKHKGYMGQYVYVPTSKSGTINIKIEYGHKLYSGSPTVSVYPAGLAITPTSSVDTASYALTLSY
ncbi:hypothetical protein M3204_09040 [Mesobacillus subterraneus]|uniref:hypothetical protein n=1 Tax=Mesobacillus subterraneus TaxID=285983 RepID=UPI002040F9D7|nr:hypothetical protein [Mesobacillus subterraneus]MCM3664546.1 hypothetical protein [Mesobacillus subterraneus]MCM3683938.1 hypothetical protein [Mesobacillus subterraneus]